MIYRDYVEAVKDAGAVALRTTPAERSPTPMLHLQLEDGRVEALPVGPAFFDNDDAHHLLGEFVRDVVDTARAEKVGWTFTANHCEIDDDLEPITDLVEVMVAIVIDRERAEVWRAPVVRYQEPRLALLGGWSSWPQTETLAPHLIQPAQEALRR